MRKDFAPMLLDFAGVCELGYLNNIFFHLSKELNDEYYFIVGRSNTFEEEKQLLNFIKNKDGKLIYIFLSDESGKIPNYFNKFYKIFRTYNRKGLYDNKKIFPIPCGYSSGHRNGWYEGEKDNKKLSEREIDIFYSGQDSPNRRTLNITLENLKNNYKTLFNVTNGFSSGYPINEYYSHLQNSKISLVPNGAVIPESFRFFESMESGCAVITSYPFKNPDFNHWYYDDCPAINIDNWSNLDKNIVNNILNNLDEYELKTKDYYNKKLSSKSVANYILENIK